MHWCEYMSWNMYIKLVLFYLHYYQSLRWEHRKSTQWAIQKHLIRGFDTWLLILVFLLYDGILFMSPMQLNVYNLSSVFLCCISGNLHSALCSFEFSTMSFRYIYIVTGEKTLIFNGSSLSHQVYGLHFLYMIVCLWTVELNLLL